MTIRGCMPLSGLPLTTIQERADTTIAGKPVKEIDKPGRQRYVADKEEGDEVVGHVN